MMPDNVVIRRDKDPTVTDRVTVLFGKSPRMEAAIEGLLVLRKAVAGNLWGYSLPISELPKLQALPEFQGVQPEMEVMGLLEQATPPEVDPRAVLPGGTLYPFQVEGLGYIMEHRGRALVGDEMGLGKTVQALAWFHHRPDLRPAVVICPASVKLQWPRYATRFLEIPEEEITIMKGRKSDPPTGQLIVCNYDILSARLSDIASVQPRVVVFDEIHLIKESKVQRAKAAKRLASLPSVESVVGLTGTPIINRPKELWHQVNVINPYIWPNFFKFAMKFCDPERRTFFVKGSGKKAGQDEPEERTSWDFSGASNLVELNQKLRSQVMIRRLKSEVLLDLPEYQTITIPFDCDLREYKKIRDEVRTRLMLIRDQLRAERERLNNLPPIEQLEALSERAEANSTLKLYGYMLGEITLLKKEAARIKMPGVKEWLLEFMESGEPLVLFAHHHEIADELTYFLTQETGIQIPVLDGRLNVKKRQEEVDRFVAGAYPVLPCGLKAMSTGVDGLQHHASNLAFVELGWGPSEHDQAASRLHRDGQKNAVSGYFLLAAGTIDEAVGKLVDAKATVVSTATGGMEEYRILESLVDLVIDGT